MNIPTGIWVLNEKKKKKERLKSTNDQKSFNMAFVRIIGVWEPVPTQERRKCLLAR